MNYCWQTRGVLAGLFLLALPLHSIGQEFTLPGDASLVPTAGNQSPPSLSHGQGLTLLVWGDDRSNPYGSYEYETSGDIYGVRLDADGDVLDATPIPIACTAATQSRPRVAWNGTNWLVVFQSFELHGTGYYYQESLQAVRVSPAGVVLDEKPIRLVGLQPSGAIWAVASDGANWVVVHQGTSTSSGIVAMRISPSGAVLDPPTRFLVSPTYYLRFNFHLAYANGVFLFTFDDQYVGGTNTTAAIRFDSSLNLLDPAPVGLLPSPVSALSSNSQGFYVVWNKQLPTYEVIVAGSRINTSGQMLDGGGVNISGPNTPQAYWPTGVDWDGTNWRAYWGFANTMRLARISSAGALLDPNGVAVAGPQPGPAVGTANSGLQFAWESYVDGNIDLKASHVNGQNVATLAANPETSAPRQTRPDVAKGGAGYMVVFKSHTGSSTRVFAMPLDAAGVALLPEPVQLDTGSSLNGPSAPCVAWNGTYYLVTWGNASGVVAQRLNASGVKVDPNPFVVMSPGFGMADVCALGDLFLVVGRRYGINPQYIFPIAARVRGSDGAVLDASPFTFSATYVRSMPAVTVVGDRWFLAYTSNVTHDDPMAFTMGAFVTSSGSAATAFTVHGPFSTAGGNGIFEVATASSGNRAIVIQSQELTSGVETDLLCRFVDSNGTVSGTTNLTPWSGNQYRPRVAWDGTHFVIAYQEQRNRFAPHTLDQLDARSDLYGMRVLPTGVIVDPLGFVFSDSPLAESDPNLTASNGITCFVGARVFHSPGLKNYRTFGKILGLGGNKWPIAVALATPSRGDVPLNVSFSSAGSNDPDGAIVAFRWEFGDGAESNLASPSHSYSLPGQYVARLTVTDNQGAATTNDVAVDATSPNIPPIAIATATPLFGPPALDVVCDASYSYDPDGFIGNVKWVFGDTGSEYWGPTGYHTFYSPGIFPVTLTVYDSRSATGTTEFYIVVGNAVDLAPSSVATTGGLYRSGNAASLAANDGDYYVIEEGPSFGSGGARAQLDASYTLPTSSLQGFVIHIESATTAAPAQNLRLRVSALNQQTQNWELLTERPASSQDTAFDVAVTSNGGRFVDPGTRQVKIRLAWHTTGIIAMRGWRTRTDLARLTALLP